jgi:hypothetical protein
MNSTKAISKGWRVVFSDKWKRDLRTGPQRDAACRGA